MLRVLACAAISIWTLVGGSGAAVAQAHLPNAASHVAGKRNTAQVEGYSLIEQAVAESGNYDPGGRAAILFLAGHSLSKVRPELAGDMFKSAYALLDQLRDEAAAGVNMLRGNIVRETALALPKEVEEALPQEPDLRDTALSALVDVYLKQKKFKHAVELASMMSDPQIYPVVRSLLESAPKSERDERARIFALAIQQYENVQHSPNIVGFPDELGTLTASFWEDLPQPLVLNAIDLLLKEADPERSRQSSQNLALTVQGDDGARVLGFYEYRLNQVIPILEHLDPAAAERLKTKRFNLVANISTKRSESIANTAIVRDSGTTLEAASNMQLRKAAEQIVSLAGTDPQEALNEASKLPDGIRAQALVGIARKYVTIDPQMSRSVLRNLAMHETPSTVSGPILADAIDVAAKVRDSQLQKTLLDMYFKKARAEFDVDANPDHPNRALKLYWPSIHEWRDAFRLAYGFQPSYALEQLNNVPEGEARSIEKLMLAGAFLSIPSWNDSPIR